MGGGVGVVCIQCIQGTLDSYMFKVNLRLFAEFPIFF